MLKSFHVSNDIDTFYVSNGRNPNDINASLCAKCKECLKLYSNTLEGEDNVILNKLGCILFSKCINTKKHSQVDIITKTEKGNCGNKGR